MTLLTTWPESGPETVVRRTADPVEIAAALAPLGVRYEQWPVREDVPFDADSETVFAPGLRLKLRLAEANPVTGALRFSLPDAPLSRDAPQRRDRQRLTHRRGRPKNIRHQSR